MSAFPSVRPSVRMELGSYWADFREIWYLSIFRNSVEKIKHLLKSDKNNGYFTWRPTYILLYLAHFFLEWDCFTQSCREKRITFYVP